jgi:transketolase
MRHIATPCCLPLSWWKYVGSTGRVLGIDSFGASGKAADLYRHFGLTPEKLQAAVLELF